MSPGLAGWLWFIESAGKRLTRACVITAWRALNTARFWRDVQLETHVVPHRIVRWAVATFSVLFLVLGLCAAIGAVVNAAYSTRAPVWAAGSLSLSPVNYSAITPKLVLDAMSYDLTATWQTAGWMPPHGPTGLLWTIGASVMAPVVVLALPHTRSRAKVRGAHIFRAAAYGFAWLAPFCVASIALRVVEVASWTVGTLGNPAVAPSPWRATPFLPRLGVSLMGGGTATFVAVVMGIWLGVYWAMVLFRGWRMRRADAVPAALSVYACMFLAGYAFAFWAGELF